MLFAFISLTYNFNEQLKVHTNTYIKHTESIANTVWTKNVYAYAKFSVHVDCNSFKISNNKVSKTNCYKSINSVLPHTHLSIDTIYNFKTKHLLENISPVVDECLHDGTVAMASSNVQSCVLLIVHDLYSSTYHCIMVNN